MFTSFVRDDATNTSYRSMLACDPQWGNEYARNAWFLDDPWLHHALRSATAIRASELNPTSAAQFAMCEASAKFGFASAVIVPAPSPAGHSRLGMLCLGLGDTRVFRGRWLFAVQGSGARPGHGTA